jgi:IclR family acetate operon transcriptional repressor
MSTVSMKSDATGTHGVSGTQAIGRTLAVLEVFRDRSDDLGISEIAGQLSLSASTVHRIVRALTAKGYLAQDKTTDRYYLGRSAVLLGQAANQRLGLDAAQAVVERLAEETEESVNLGVRDGDDMVVVIRAESKHPLRLSQEPGSRLPVYASSMGKATLAYSGRSIDEELDSLARPLRAITSRTITSERKLRRELEVTRSRGYSIDDEEAISGVRCVGAPILGVSSVVLGAIAVQAPAVRMSHSRLKTLAPLVRKAAEDVARVLPATHRI